MSAATKRPGRPRSAAADQAILAATLDVTREYGLNGLSMDEVAQRAGVSKTTIYRRWSSREALVIDALQRAINPIDEIDHGSLEADLRAYVGLLTERMSTGMMSKVLPHLIDVAVHNPQLRHSLDAYVDARRQPLRKILENGRERGELRPDVDLDVVVDTVIGPCIYRHLLTSGPLDQAFADQLLSMVLPNILITYR